MARRTREERLLSIAELKTEGNFAEAALQAELLRKGIENEPYPDKCPHCGAGEESFEESGGMVGETIVYCTNCKSIIWEDSEGAIRAVF